MSAPIVQARKVRGASQIGRSAPAIHTWDTKDGNTITLHDVEAGMGADRTWKLQLSASEGDDLGHIFIYYYAAQRELKPDGLEVPRTKQGFGYGAVLGKTAVAAMKLEALRGLTGDAKTVFLNLVNPLSAHISSIKELNLNLNGGDPQDADAASDAATAVGTTTLDTKLYDKTRFPSFWGRLVYLAKNNGVIFEHASFPGARGNAETDFSRQAAEGMLDAVLRAKAGTFGMNIRAPLPDF